MRWILMLVLLVPMAATSCGGCGQSVAIFAMGASGTRPLQVPGTVNLISTSGYSIDSCRSKAFTQVKFYNNDVLIGTDSSAPFSVDWKMVAGQDGLLSSGSGQVKLKAVGDDGTTTEVETIDYTVKP
jgi:hypothetical protein